MPQAPSIDDSAHEVRREINALHGLLCFSQERRYPEGVRRSLREMLLSLESRLALHEQAARSQDA